jgi:putative tryptophan/tyrosine transport system substrate-binding protein
MKRRGVTTLINCGIASALWPQRARSADKICRIAFVVTTGQFVDAKEGDAWKGLVIAFLESMQALGYVDGRNIKFDFLFG